MKGIVEKAEAVEKVGKVDPMPSSGNTDQNMRGKNVKCRETGREKEGEREKREMKGLPLRRAPKPHFLA